MIMKILGIPLKFIGKWIDKLIKLSGNNFIYSHISINSKGDMIIYTSSSSSNERKFYGLKKDGTPFFGTFHNKSMFISSNFSRADEECLFVNFTKDKDYSNPKEIITCIPQNNTKNIEYYLLDDKPNYIEQPCSDIFEDITSSRFSGIQIPSDNNLTYVFSYINNKQIIISLGYFDNTNGEKYILTSKFKVDNSTGNMISCYFTKNIIYVCFYIGNYEYKHVSFTIPIRNETKIISNDQNNKIGEFDENSREIIKLFYKAIHLKEEYVAFAYFQNKNSKNLRIKIKVSKNITLETYINETKLQYKGCANDKSLNDLIKLNDEQICFVSSENNDNKKNLFIVIITINFDRKLISPKYFDLKIGDNNNFFFYNQIISNLYNNFIIVAFNHNLESVMNYGSSFIILGYPSSEDYSFYIIDEIINNKLPINKLSFNITESLNIENNILDYTFVGTLIKNFSNQLELLLDNTSIERESIILKDKNITISFPNKDGIYKNNIFQIEYAFIVQESSSYSPENSSPRNFTGKYSNVSFIIEKDIYCFNDSYAICNDALELLVHNSNINIEHFREKCNHNKQTDYIINSEIYEKESETYDIVEEKNELTNSISKKK